MAADVLLRVLRHQAGQIRAYLFGSCLRDPSTARDIDIVLIYPDGLLDDAARLAASLRDLDPAQTYDVIVLSQAEEDELSFVPSVGAVLIWPQPAVPIR